MKLVTRRKLCRVCGSRKLDSLHQVAPTPLPAYVAGANPEQNVPREVFVCTKCGHVQNTDVILPDSLYTPSPVKTDPARAKALDRLAASVMERTGLREGNTVVDIGSGDGHFLAALKRAKCSVRGVEASTQAAQKAEGAGIPTLQALFDAQVASRLRRDKAFADVVTALSVIHLMDNLQAFVNCTRYFLKPDGWIVVETPYALSLLEQAKPSDLGHGRLSFYSLKELSAIFAQNRMTMVHAERTDSEGGSVLCFARTKRAAAQPDESLAALLAAEEKAKLTDPDTWRAWAKR